MITAEELYKILHYDPITGVFTWLVKMSSRAMPGMRAGTVERKPAGCGSPRRHIGIRGKLYYEHRLAWLYVFGVWPDNEIDHKDGNAENNAWLNLREADHSENGCNRPKSDTKSGLPLGVYFVRDCGKFAAQIKKNKQWKWLGLHDTSEQAASAYRVAAEQLHGRFAYHVSRQ